MINNYDPNQDFSQYPEDDNDDNDDENENNNADLDDYEIQKLLSKTERSSK